MPTHCCHGINTLLPWCPTFPTLATGQQDVHRQQVPLPSSSSCSFLQARITKTACKEWEQGAVTKEERHVTKEERHVTMEERHVTKEERQARQQKQKLHLASSLQLHREPVPFSHYMCSCGSALCQSRVQSPLSSSLPMILLTLRAHSTPRLHIHSCSFQTR